MDLTHSEELMPPKRGGNDQTSEGYVGDGNPTNDRISANQIQEGIAIYESVIKKASPPAWAKIELLIDRLKQTVPRRETLVLETSKLVSTSSVSPRVIQVLGRLAADTIANTLETSRMKNEAMTADGVALDMIELILALAYERLSDVASKDK